ncbi:hypothetical protein AHAS_Ahas01G0221800 [Arachis hypogaea]
MVTPDKYFLVTDLPVNHHHLIPNLTYHSVLECKVRCSSKNVRFEVVILDGGICSFAFTTISTYHHLSSSWDGA